MLRAVARGLGRLIPVAIAAAAVVIGAVIGFSPATSSLAPRVITAPAGADPAPSTVSGAWRDKVVRHAPLSYTVADAAGPLVQLYSAPDRPLVARPTMANPTW